MIKYIILFILIISGIRALVIAITLIRTQTKLNRRFDEICNSLTDERAVKDLEIELNKIDWYLDADAVVRDFVMPFNTIDTQKWLNPDLVYLLYEHYKVD